MSTQWKYNKKGVSIIEILIVIAIASIGLASLLGVATFSLKLSILRKEASRANALAQEVVEATRSFRDGTSWNIDGLGTLIVGVAYYPQKTVDVPPQWTLVQGEDIINGFTRKIIFSSVMRDVNDNIIESGGINDPNTKKATTTVSWKDKQVEIVTYLTNWQ